MTNLNLNFTENYKCWQLTEIKSLHLITEMSELKIKYKLNQNEILQNV